MRLLVRDHRSSRATTRTAVTGVGLLALAGSALAPGLVAPAHAQETCRGVAATVVGTPGVPLTGTPDRDVVVTHGATVVSTLGGDDLVCVTGGTAYVDTATGADTVDTVGAGGAPVSVWLGAGKDRFFGGDGDDTVGTHSEDLVKDTHVDTVLTGGGDDVVHTGSRGDNHDTVDLGDGNDRLLVRGRTGARKGTISGGPGADTLVLDLSGKAKWRVDNVRGVARKGKKRLHRWVAFERFDLQPTRGQFTFVGSSANERLDYADHSGGPVGPTTVRMGAGNDRVLVPAQAPAGSRYDGGEGRNRVEISSPGERIVVDLTAGRIDHGRRRGPAAEATLTSFRDATVWAKYAAVKGSVMRNRLAGGGCVVKLWGTGGGDHLKRLDSPAYDCRKRSKLLGGTGNDKLVGGEGRDKLFGGKGRDKAFGGPGRDTCRAEKRKQCERR